MRSFTKKLVNERFEAAGYPAADPGRYTNKVFYNERDADPSGMDERNTDLEFFVLVGVLGGGGVRAGDPLQIQVDCFHRIGTLASGDDEFGYDANRIADDFKAIWYPNDCGIKVWDFVVPGTPVETAAWMVATDAEGARATGLPAFEDVIQTESGWQRVILTYHLRLDNSLQAQPIYWDATI